MKKLLVLTLVLGIASLATAGPDLSTLAGLSYEVDTDNNIVTISGSGVTGYGFSLQADDNSALATNLIPAGFSTQLPGYFYASYGQLLGVGASVGTGAAVDGTIYAFSFTPGATSVDFVYSSLVGTSAFNVGGQAYNAVGYTITIPEPATMAILGLGGLFLARRKK